MSKKLFSHAVDDRDGMIVRLPGAELDGDGRDDWYSKDHKGHLHCPGCNARVHFVKAVGSMNGSKHAGNDNHFQTNPGSAHEASCEIGQKQKEQEPREKPDRNLGAVINLNSLILERDDPVESLIGGELRREFGKAANPETKGMERISVRSLADVLKFIHRNSRERVEQSVVHFQGQEIPFPLYLQSLDNDAKSVKALIKSLRQQDVKVQPILFDVDHSSIEKGQNSGKENMIKTKSVFLGKTDKGIKHFAVIRFFIDHFADNGPRIPFWKEGHSMVQGIAKYKVEDASTSIKCVFHYISLELHSGIQVKPGISLAELYEPDKDGSVARKLGYGLFGFGHAKPSQI